MARLELLTARACQTITAQVGPARSRLLSSEGVRSPALGSWELPRFQPSTWSRVCLSDWATETSGQRALGGLGWVAGPPSVGEAVSRSRSSPSSSDLGSGLRGAHPARGAVPCSSGPRRSHLSSHLCLFTKTCSFPRIDIPGPSMASVDGLRAVTRLSRPTCPSPAGRVAHVWARLPPRERGALSSCSWCRVCHSFAFFLL